MGVPGVLIWKTSTNISQDILGINSDRQIIDFKLII